jgi:peptidoglycan/LPS O-acetylase OafA/YrhL
MNPAYRTLAIICVALIVAVATFFDRIALAIGGVGLMVGMAVVLIIIAGAVLSLRRKTRVEKLSLVEEKENCANGDLTRPPS